MHTILLNSQYYGTPAPTGCGPHRPIVMELPDGGLRGFVGSNCDTSVRMYCAHKFNTNMIPIARYISTILQLGFPSIPGKTVIPL